MIIDSIGNVVVGVLDKFFPNQTEIKKADLELKKAAIDAEIQLQLANLGLLKGQLDINKEEAANPNRKWVTWRELVGYALALAVWWDMILKPFMAFAFEATGHPLDLSKIPALDMNAFLFLLGGMLGMPVVGYMQSKIKGMGKK